MYGQLFIYWQATFVTYFIPSPRMNTVVVKIDGTPGKYDQNWQ